MNMTYKKRKTLHYYRANEKSHQIVTSSSPISRCVSSYRRPRPRCSSTPTRSPPSIRRPSLLLPPCSTTRNRTRTRTSWPSTCASPSSTSTSPSARRVVIPHIIRIIRPSPRAGSRSSSLPLLMFILVRLTRRFRHSWPMRLRGLLLWKRRRKWLWLWLWLWLLL